jgi:hypothetical protein
MRFATISIAALIAVAWTADSAISYSVQASICQGQLAGDRNALIYNAYAVQNDDPSAAHSINCPLFYETVGLLDLETAKGASVDIFDRNVDASVSCNMEVTDHNGVFWAAPSRFSCATDGGCTSPSGFLDAAQKPHRLTLSVALPGFRRQSIRCTVPALTVNGHSGIASFNYRNE